MNISLFTSFVFVTLVGSTLSAQTPKPTATAVGTVRTIQSDASKVTELTLREGKVTTLIFPEGVGIVDWQMGDRTLWDPQKPAENRVVFKPVTGDIDTNLLITLTNGQILAFFLRERKTVQPDFVVTVETGDTPATATKYYTAAEVEPIKAELQAAYARIDAVQKQAEDALNEVRGKVPTRLFYYEVKNVAPFRVQGMVHDGEKTYLKIAGREAPVVYEMVDNKPSMVNYQVQNGTTYVFSKVLGSGYLVLGKQRLGFKPETNDAN